jgi:hypothetical protein
VVNDINCTIVILFFFPFAVSVLSKLIDFCKFVSFYENVSYADCYIQSCLNREKLIFSAQKLYAETELATNSNICCFSFIKYCWLNMEQILKQQNNINEIKNYFNIVQKSLSIIYDNEITSLIDIYFLRISFHPTNLFRHPV